MPLFNITITDSKGEKITIPFESIETNIEKNKDDIIKLRGSFPPGTEVEPDMENKLKAAIENCEGYYKASEEKGRDWQQGRYMVPTNAELLTQNDNHFFEYEFHQLKEKKQDILNCFKENDRLRENNLKKLIFLHPSLGHVKVTSINVLAANQFSIVLPGMKSSKKNEEWLTKELEQAFQLHGERLDANNQTKIQFNNDSTVFNIIPSTRSEIDEEWLKKAYPNYFMLPGTKKADGLKPEEDKPKPQPPKDKEPEEDKARPPKADLLFKSNKKTFTFHEIETVENEIILSGGDANYFSYEDWPTGIYKELGEVLSSKKINFHPDGIRPIFLQEVDGVEQVLPSSGMIDQSATYGIKIAILPSEGTTPDELKNNLQAAFNLTDKNAARKTKADDKTRKFAKELIDKLGLLLGVQTGPGLTLVELKPTFDIALLCDNIKPVKVKEKPGYEDPGYEDGKKTTITTGEHEGEEVTATHTVTLNTKDSLQTGLGALVKAAKEELIALKTAYESGKTIDTQKLQQLHDLLTLTQDTLGKMSAKDITAADRQKLVNEYKDKALKLSFSQKLVVAVTTIVVGLACAIGGAIAGMFVGGLIGGTVGSVVPVLGNIAGGIGGAGAGMVAGAVVGMKAGLAAGAIAGAAIAGVGSAAGACVLSRIGFFKYSNTNYNPHVYKIAQGMQHIVDRDKEREAATSEERSLGSRLIAVLKGA